MSDDLKKYVDCWTVVGIKQSEKKAKHAPAFFSRLIRHNSFSFLHDDDVDDDETGDICLFYISAGFLHFSHTLQISTNKIGLF